MALACAPEGKDTALVILLHGIVQNHLSILCP